VLLVVKLRHIHGHVERRVHVRESLLVQTENHVEVVRLGVFVQDVLELFRHPPHDDLLMLSDFRLHVFLEPSQLDLPVLDFPLFLSAHLGRSRPGQLLIVGFELSQFLGLSIELRLLLLAQLLESGDFRFPLVRVLQHYFRVHDGEFAGSWLGLSLADDPSAGKNKKTQGYDDCGPFSHSISPEIVSC